MIKKLVFIGAFCAASPAYAQLYSEQLQREIEHKEMLKAIEQQTMEQSWAAANRDYEMQKQRDAIDRQTDAILLQSLVDRDNPPY